ncbi:MAG: nuclease-related domain-containing protein [Candidatus Hermodarchaeota archaeon]
MPDPRTFEIKATIVMESEKGLLLSLPDGKQEWFPKSTISSSYISNHSKVQDFLIAKWILEKKGIIKKSKNINIIGRSGSEEYLIERLQKQGIHGFNSFKDIRRFKNNFIKILKRSAAKERKKLNSNIISLKNDEFILKKILEGKKSVLQQTLLKEKAELMDKPLNSKGKKRIKKIDNTIEKKLDQPFNKDIKEIKKIKKKYILAQKNLEKSVEKKVNKVYKALEIIQKNQQFYDQAVREAAVIKELRKLPETYYILNEVRLSFYRSIRWKKYGEYVQSCKIDHVVVGPTGIFLIEPMNQSPQTTQTAKSPSHKQIQRSGYIVFIQMMDQFGKKYPLYQIVATFKQLPESPYDFVMQLTIEELVDYILGRDGRIEPPEVLTIVEWLQNSPYIFNAKHVYLKLKF